MATIGQQLTVPDAGWKRYDDKLPSIVYTGIWTNSTTTGSYNGDRTASNDPLAKAEFMFKGTKLRLIGLQSTSYSDSVSIEIDEKTYTFSQYNTAQSLQVLCFEVTELTNEIHKVKISHNDTNFMNIDAIDIDLDGRMFHPEEVTDVSQLDIGKRIRCNYAVTTSGVVGVFSNLGKETDSLIPTSGSIPATHKGDFYFIMADEYNEKKILIADRNIQSFMSWDVLNNNGLVYGVPVDMKDERFSFVSRVLSGGINSTDTDNEWYKYIVTSTLNDSIVAGDNAVWNWSSGNAYSWTSTTASSNATYRMRRGLSAVNAANAPASSTALATSGYRPVFEVKTLPMMKSFIYHDGSYKKYNEPVSGSNYNGWSVISATLPSEDTFISDGMNDLSILNRKNKDFVQAMSANGSLGSGKVLKGAIDLNKYFEITKLTVK